MVLLSQRGNDENISTVSLILPSRNDLNNKVKEVKKQLKKKCCVRNIPFIEHNETIQPDVHLTLIRVDFLGARFGVGEVKLPHLSKTR